MAAARELLTAYISLEVLSFSLYVLVSFAKMDAKSNEGGMKYMLLGAFASALFLYGMSLIYGIAGSTFYGDISAALSSGIADFDLAMLLGLVLIVAALGFKVAAVPFHMWTPDAYEGAPLPITAYLSATSKAAGFALLIRLFAGAFQPVLDDWQWMIAALAAASMTVGNLVAIQQHNIKRLLAYSSIVQVGFMLMGIAALSEQTTSALVRGEADGPASGCASRVATTAARTDASGSARSRRRRGSRHWPDCRARARPSEARTDGSRALSAGHSSSLTSSPPTSTRAATAAARTAGPSSASRSIRR